MPYRDDDHHNLDPREFPDPDDADHGRMPCPNCQALIWDGSERCPKCGNYLPEEDAAHRHPWWVLLGVLVCLAMAIHWIWPGP